MDFHYKHRDGRTGTGDSVWRAMVSALGVKDAAEISTDQLRELAWDFPPSGVFISDREVHKTADLLTMDDEFLGSVSQFH